jgi:class 3 adenylate cyclase/PAS domain-containing protein
MGDGLDSDKSQLDEKSLGAKQVLKYAEDLASLYVSLQGSEKRYRALFEYSPISLWEEDFSRVKKHIDAVREKGIKDLRKYFEDHPEELARCTQMIKILDVNKSTLELYEAESKEEVSRSLSRIMAERSNEVLKEQLIAVAEGKIFETQIENRTLKGKELTVLMKASIPPGYEKTWSKVLVSIHDLTERMRAQFLKEMFGRYLSEEVMHTLLEDPDSVKLGGEKRRVTIMMTDLRGFTALSEHLDPEQVIQLLNAYFEVMVDVLLKYGGTINEIIGDALLVIFGAPQQMPDRAQRAVACAIEMQNAMAHVNEQNRTKGLPKLEMGIALNDAEVIVGNVGSQKRSKYGVVGSGVNMTGRIESYTVGGQILISESARKEAGEELRIDNRLEIRPKGAETPLTVYEVGGIGGRYNLAIEQETLELLALAQEIPIRYTVLDAKHVGEGELAGRISQLSPKCGEMRLKVGLELHANLKFNLLDVSEELARKDFYGKVTESSDSDPGAYRVQFTALPPGVDGYFQAALQHGTKEKDAF